MLESDFEMPSNQPKEGILENGFIYAEEHRRLLCCHVVEESNRIVEDVQAGGGQSYLTFVNSRIENMFKDARRFEEYLLNYHLLASELDRIGLGGHW